MIEEVSATGRASYASASVRANRAHRSGLDFFCHPARPGRSRRDRGRRGGRRGTCFCSFRVSRGLLPRGTKRSRDTTDDVRFQYLACLSATLEGTEAASWTTRDLRLRYFVASSLRGLPLLAILLLHNNLGRS